MSANKKGAGKGPKSDVKIQLVVKAGQATPTPPVGPVLAQNGVNVVEFCKQFNDKTKDQEPGTPLRTVITAHADRTFSFIVKLPSVSYLLVKKGKLEKGKSAPGRDEPSVITSDVVREVAEMKMSEMNAFDIDAAIKMVEGTAISMGLKVQ